MERFMYEVRRAKDFIAQASSAIDDNTREYLCEAKEWFEDTECEYSTNVAIARYILEEFCEEDK